MDWRAGPAGKPLAHFVDRGIQHRAKVVQVIDDSRCAAHGFASRTEHCRTVRRARARVCSLLNISACLLLCYVRARTVRKRTIAAGAVVAWFCGAMSATVQSSSSEHNQAASDHERAARQHRAAAGFHDRNMLLAARLSSESARASCIAAHRHSMTACGHSEGEEQVKR
jgi:hypothetical protein